MENVSFIAGSNSQNTWLLEYLEYPRKLFLGTFTLDIRVPCEMIFPLLGVAEACALSPAVVAYDASDPMHWVAFQTFLVFSVSHKVEYCFFGIGWCP